MPYPGSQALKIYVGSHRVKRQSSLNGALQKKLFLYYFKEEDEMKPKSQKKVQKKSTFTSQLKSIQNSV